VIGWLLDTNVVSALINPNGAPSVKAWAAAQDEEDLHLSVLTLAEYDKGIFNLAEDHPDRQRYIASRAALESRFERRILPVGNAVVRRWGRISGTIKRETGHPPQVIDALLAATAIEHDLYLVSRNVRDMSRTGATLLDPWNDDSTRFPLSPRRKSLR
jgi:predicted nucleic acid-binding protein